MAVGQCRFRPPHKHSISLYFANIFAADQSSATQPTSRAEQPAADSTQTVRFASVNQEIEPSNSLQSTTQASETPAEHQQISTKAEKEIRNLALSLHKSRIQQKRMSSFAFEPVSLPASRVQSNEVTPQNATREVSKSEELSLKASSTSTMPTPPLTPSGTHTRENKSSDGLGQVRPDATRLSPQISGSKSRSSTPGNAAASSTAVSAQASSQGDYSTQATSQTQQSASAESKKHVSTGFSVGPSGSSTSLPDSREQSRDESPSATKEVDADVTAPSQVSISYPRPLAPHGDRDDPYARSKRPPQPRNLDAVENRFIFSKGDPRRRSGINLSSSAASSPIPRASSGTDLKNDHRGSNFSLHGLSGGRKESGAALEEKHHHHGSMSELKRFFFGGHHKSKRTQSPSASVKKSATGSTSGTRTPPHQAPAASVPFADDHGLVTKYGKFEKFLGSGAGGSVRLMKRSNDGVTFAVKQFRDRHNYESEKDYNKKVTAEFCIGSTLHHGNIIETLDIIHEGGKWYEVMEYAPFDLFACVMTGKMSREEVNCCFLQIVAGVAFLHSMGLAHRDLKLDNVVVNSEGIMKLIDFGSAVVFRYPFETDIILASGIHSLPRTLTTSDIRTNLFYRRCWLRSLLSP